MCSALDTLVSLEDLNLAANRISYFSDCMVLLRLKNLHHLFLSDIHFGSNPIVCLPNYKDFFHYFILHSCSALVTFDGYRILPEAKSESEMMHMSKKLYYNMKTKAIHRNANTLLRNATLLLKQTQSLIDSRIGQATRMMKDIEREEDEIQIGIYHAPQTIFSTLGKWCVLASLPLFFLVLFILRVFRREEQQFCLIS